MDAAARRRMKAALIVNALIIGLECAGLWQAFFHSGSEMLEFYTEDSNLFSLFASLWYLVSGLIRLKRNAPVSRTAKRMRYAAACMLSLTFLIVIFVLAPQSGYGHFLLEGQFLYTHLLCPVLSFISFAFLERVPHLRRRDAWYAWLPTAVYAIVLITMNLLRQTVGPYPFLHIYEQPWEISILWALLILGGDYLLAVLMIRLDGRKTASAK